MKGTTTATPALLPRVEHVLRLADIIREVDAKNDSKTFVLGAVSLAEEILSHPGFSGCHDAPAALPAPEPGEVEELLEFLDSLAALPIFDRDCAARIRRVAEVLKGIPFSLPSDYIDPEYQGEDRKLLEAFQRAWWAESGSSDKCHMAGIRAVMALRPSVAEVRAADAAISAEALEAEFRAWWKAKVHIPAADYRARHACATHVAWGRHLLSRGEL